MSDQPTDPQQEEKWFPVCLPMTTAQAAKAGPSSRRIPWSVAEKAYSVYAGRYGHGQSLERLAERGGFHAEELDDLYPGWRIEASEITALREALQQLRERHEELTTWKANQQAALIAMAVSLVDTGYKGDGVLEGIEYLKAQLAATNALRARHEALTAALKGLRIDANRLCDRMLGGSYEADCRRAIAVADAVLDAEYKLAKAGA